MAQYVQRDDWNHYPLRNRAQTDAKNRINRHHIAILPTA